MDINFLEILFITNVIVILIIWIWFVIMGFRANKAWGFSIIFLPPVIPFMFAARFARKARRAIYYHAISWFILIIIVGYIQFASIGFYTSLLSKIAPDNFFTFISEALNPNDEKKDETSSTEGKINLEIIDGATDEKPANEEIVDDETVDKKTVVKEKVKSKKRSYKAVNMNDMRLYIGKNVIVSTPTKKIKGRLSSVSTDKLIIKKRLGGGFASMPIKKSKIKKVEVYLR